MRWNDLDFDDIHNIIAFRIIVDDVASCNQAVGVVHLHYKPVPGNIKDYIAVSIVSDLHIMSLHHQVVSHGDIFIYLLHFVSSSSSPNPTDIDHCIHQSSGPRAKSKCKYVRVTCTR